MLHKLQIPQYLRLFWIFLAGPPISFYYKILRIGGPDNLGAADKVKGQSRLHS